MLLMENIYRWHNETLGKQVVKALEKNDFHAIYFDTKEQAENFIIYHVKQDDKVGFGGSMTIKSMNLEKKIVKIGATVLDHGVKGLSKEEKLEVMRQELTSDLFLCSSNAVTLSGELINVDGTGNRVAALSFGPKKVIVVVGINKIVSNVEEGINRIKLIAAPKNNKRLGFNNPCIFTGHCENCNAQNRICRIYSILRKKPMLSDVSVVIVGEELGY